ncbi:STAS domain-containing protein [Streptomyces sp. NPDC057445]|uniref:STAS domain-containing protein n=1 Tax=Streptomyces sp. NPDC057445 TaxID=3346136 RepID=UPI0036922481
MPLPQLTLYRHDKNDRALITLAGEIDLSTQHLVRASLLQCLRDGIRAIDVDLTALTFCDVTGLNAFLDASQATSAAGGSLRLHHPPPVLARVLALTGTATLLLGRPDSGFGNSPVQQHVSGPDSPHRMVPARPAISMSVL